MMNKSCRIGFISTRLSGTDGVSLETEKWARILQAHNHECFYFAGEADRPPERTFLVPEAHFKHPLILSLTEELFGRETRSEATSATVHSLKDHLKVQLRQFVRAFGIDMLIVENALSLPMNIPLGLALTEFIAETRITTIAHHHDFSWERKRYAVSAAEDYLRTAFPPSLRTIRHVVINSFAARQLALRTGASSILITNVMDFDWPPPLSQEHTGALRAALDLKPEEHLLLQPTRIVPRKRIELAIELARRLRLPCALVVTHSSSDEGSDYEAYLEEHARLIGVRYICAPGLFNHQRRKTEDAKQVYSLADAYQACGLVTYPSLVEGFGNAFLETIYYRRPLVMSTYEIFKTDIQPKGFRVVGFDEFIGEETVRQAREVLKDPQKATEMGDHNFEIGRRYYSFRTLEHNLVALMEECGAG